MSLFTSEQFWSLIRTLLQSAGAALVTRGLIDSGSAEIVVGLAMNVLTTVYSLWLRRNAGLIVAAASLPGVDRVVASAEIVRKVNDPAVTTR